MSSKHSPSPWSAELNDGSEEVGEFTIRDADGGYVADVRNPYSDYGMQVDYAAHPDCRIEPDARLIAAAPELVDSVRALLALHEAHHNHPDHAAARKLLSRIDEGRS